MERSSSSSLTLKVQFHVPLDADCSLQGSSALDASQTFKVWRLPVPESYSNFLSQLSSKLNQHGVTTPLENIVLTGSADQSEPIASAADFDRFVKRCCEQSPPFAKILVAARPAAPQQQHDGSLSQLQQRPTSADTPPAESPVPSSPANESVEGGEWEIVQPTGGGGSGSGGGNADKQTPQAGGESAGGDRPAVSLGDGAANAARESAGVQVVGVRRVVPLVHIDMSRHTRSGNAHNTALSGGSLLDKLRGHAAAVRAHARRVAIKYMPRAPEYVGRVWAPARAWVGSRANCTACAVVVMAVLAALLLGALPSSRDLPTTSTPRTTRQTQAETIAQSGTCPSKEVLRAAQCEGLLATCERTVAASEELANAWRATCEKERQVATQCGADLLACRQGLAAAEESGRRTSAERSKTQADVQSRVQGLEQQLRQCQSSRQQTESNLLKSHPKETAKAAQDSAKQASPLADVWRNRATRTASIAVKQVSKKPDDWSATAPPVSLSGMSGLTIRVGREDSKLSLDLGLPSGVSELTADVSLGGLLFPAVGFGKAASGQQVSAVLGDHRLCRRDPSLEDFSYHFVRSDLPEASRSERAHPAPRTGPAKESEGAAGWNAADGLGELQDEVAKRMGQWRQRVQDWFQDVSRKMPGQNFDFSKEKRRMKQTLREMKRRMKTLLKTPRAERQRQLRRLLTELAEQAQSGASWLSDTASGLWESMQQLGDRYRAGGFDWDPSDLFDFDVDAFWEHAAPGAAGSSEHNAANECVQLSNDELTVAVTLKSIEGLSPTEYAARHLPAPPQALHMEL